jgi:hypothetical protein
MINLAGSTAAILSACLGIGLVVVTIWSFQFLKDHARWRTLVIVLYMISAVINLHCAQSYMNDMRKTHKLTPIGVVDEAEPLVRIVQVAFGAFRGIIADLLFLRYTKMQEAENYFELVQLGSWIVKLQPTFTAATAFHAWNMTYNLSVTFQSYDDRWRWVRQGIELIRDEALSYNPGDPLLFYELGWFYQHKLGQNLDDANRYYKYHMARDLTRVLGNNRKYDWEALAVAPADREKLSGALGDLAVDQILAMCEEHKLTLGQVAASYRSSASMPGQFSEAAAATGIRNIIVAAVTSDVEDLEQILDAIRVEADRYFDALLASFDLNYPQFEAEYRSASKIQNDVADALAQLGWLDLVRANLERRWIVEERNLDPAFIAQLIREYGYLDFRLPQAHAVYWARQGLLHAEGNMNLKCERMIFQSLNDAYFAGRLVYMSADPTKWRSLMVATNTELVDNVKAAYLSAADNHESNKSVRAGFENFMVDAIVNLYVTGKERKAGEYIQYMRTENPTQPRYQKTLDEFVFHELSEDVNEATQDQGNRIVPEFLSWSYRSLALGEYKQAVNFDNQARKAWQIYMDSITEKQKDIDRRALHTIENYRKAILNRMLEPNGMDPELQAWLRFELKRWAATDPKVEALLKSVELTEDLVGSSQLEMVQVEEQQVCTACSRELPITEFPRREARAGRTRECQICTTHKHQMPLPTAPQKQR